MPITRLTSGLLALLLAVRTNTPGEFAAFIGNERAQNAKLVKFAGIKIE